MIKFYDPSGESYFGQATITRTTSVNGGLSLTGEVFAGDDVLSGLDYGWWLNFDNENYVITYKKLSDDNNTIVFDAVQKFFWDFAKVALHSEYNGSHTYDFYLEKLFSESGYTYQNDATVPAFEKDNWGYKNKLSLFNDIMDQADVEFEVHNNKVHIAKQIGSDLTSFVRKGINLSDLTEEMKISDFATYAKGYGAFKDSDDQSKGRLEVEYRSELAKKFGDLEMDPIVDERYTVADNLIAALKNQVDATYTVSMTMNIYDLENAGYPNYESPKVGDWILAIDEALNFKRKVRIIELEEQFDATGNRIGYTATCGDLSIIDQYTNIQSSLDSRVQSIQRSVDDVAISADGKSSNYYGAKEPASADDGDLWFDQSNSDPDKWSIKQWANGRWEQLTLNPGEVDAKVSVAKKAVDADIAAANTELAVAQQDISDLQVNLKANDDTQAQLTKDLAANSTLITKNKADVDVALETVNNNLSRAQTDTATAVKNADDAVENANKAVSDAGFATDIANDAKASAADAHTEAANALGQASKSVDDAKIAVADATTAKGQAANALGQANTAIGNAADALDKFNNMQIGGTNLLAGTSGALRTFSGSNWGSSNLSSNDISLISGQTYTARMWIQGYDVPTNLVVRAYSASGSQIAYAVGNAIGANSSGYSTITWTPDSNWTNNVISTLSFTSSQSDTHSGQYSELKLEKGNKATDWSPAPEDQATIDWTKAQLDIKDGKISAAVTSLKSDITNATSGMATQTWTQGKLDLTADGLTSQISSVQDGLDTKYTRLEQTLSGVQVTANNAATQSQYTQLAGQITSVIGGMGQKNLIKNTDFNDLSEWTFARPEFWRLGTSRYDSYKGSNTLFFDGVNNTSWTEARSNAIPVADGEVISASAILFATGTIDEATPTGSVQIEANFYDTIDGPRQEIYGKKFNNADPYAKQLLKLDNIKVPAGRKFVRLLYMQAGARIAIAHPMLVKDTFVGEYQPNTVSESQITQLQSDINLRVTKNDVINQINISPESILISGQKVHITGQTTIDAASIQSAAIANLDAAKITSGSISSDRLVTTKLNADNITSGSIAAARIATTALSATNITSGTLDVGKLTVKNLSADLIASGTIDASKITVKNLSASNIIGGELDAGAVNVKNLSASKLTAGTIDANNINVIHINGQNIVSGSITADKLDVNAILVGLNNSLSSISITPQSISIDPSDPNLSGISINPNDGLMFSKGSNKVAGVHAGYSGKSLSGLLVFDQYLQTGGQGFRWGKINSATDANILMALYPNESDANSQNHVSGLDIATNVTFHGNIYSRSATTSNDPHLHFSNMTGMSSNGIALLNDVNSGIEIDNDGSVYLVIRNQRYNFATK